MLCCWQAGLDSLGAVELRNAVASTFGLAAPASVAFDYPTQDALAAYIGSQLAAAVKPSALVSVRHHQPGRMTTDIVSIACEYPGGENTGDSTTLYSLCPLQDSEPQSHSGSPCGSHLLERLAAFNSQGCNDASLEGLGPVS